MSIILVFGVTLLVVVLISGFAARTVLSTALLFLLAGALASYRYRIDRSSRLYMLS